MIERLTTRQGKFPGYVNPSLVAQRLREMADQIQNGKIFIEEVATRGFANSAAREEFAIKEITIAYYEEVDDV